MIHHNELSPLWLDSGPKRSYPALRRHLEVDIAVVGAGVTGLTTAYLLAKAGVSVVVLEAGRVAEGESGRTTAHLTHVADALPHVRRRLDLGTTKLVWDGLKLAITQIERTIAEEGLDCDFARVPGYLFTDDKDRADDLLAVEKAAHAMGYPCVQACPAGLAGAAVDAMLEFPEQGRLHPAKYLAGLAGRLADRRVPIYEDTHVDHIEDGEPVIVSTVTGEEVRCRQVVIASHVPMNRVTLHTKLAAYRTYVIGLRVPRGAFPDALFWDMQTPYHYVRIQPGSAYDVLVVGGEDHKTGRMDDGTTPFAALTQFAHRDLGMPHDVLYRWSGQIMEPVDGRPFIGENPGSRHEFVATGYGGDGMTYGTLAAHMLAERIQGRETPWDKAFDPHRLGLHGVKDVREFVGTNADFPAYLIRDRLDSGLPESPANLRPGEGGLYRLAGRRLAIARLDDGRLVALSPVCTHLGCIVHYNDLERTWDCPCHGSRYSSEGGVLNGPAVKDLEPLPLATVESEPAERVRVYSDVSDTWVTT